MEDFIGYDLRCKPKNWHGEFARRCEIKFDGYRMTIARKLDGSFYAWGRRPSDLWSKVFSCVKDIEPITKIPKGTIIDGELYVPDSLSTSVATALAEGAPVADFQPFAVPFCAGVDLRRSGFDERDQMLAMMNLPLPPSLSIWSDCEEDLQALAKDLNVEGFVLKAHHYAQWYKVKRHYTIDAFVTGWKRGEGKHAGRLGSLHLGLWTPDGVLDIGSVGIGQDAAWRDLEPMSVIGRVVEVRHEGLQRGALRFARFVRWREDRDPESCLPSQLGL